MALFEPTEKIALLEAFSTMPICALLGAIAAWVGIALGWSSLGMVVFSLALCLTFMLTPLAGLVRKTVRRWAEKYYYGT
jgi:hypothetical protein